MIHAPTKGKHHAIRYCLSDKIFLGFNWLILTLFLIVLAYPLLYIVVSSFSSIPITGISLIPQRPSFDGYTAVFNYRYIWIGYANSLKYLVLGTFIALFVTVCCAYPLSRSDCKGGKYVMAACVFTMYFSGGMIPSFLWIKNLGFLDTVWALVLPGCLSVYNMIVMRTYFKNNIPTELHEASQLDGCNDYRFIWSIVLPLSGPILAVIGLYYAVSLWNGYFNAMLYIRTRTKLPLSMFLREILVLNQSSGVDAGMDPTQMEIAEARAQLMKYSLIIVSSLPVMIIYPFVQRYFVKGVMVGAVKG
ncbi:MAG: carbohydrate ABC transporter permease [Clostridia bacterium]|nr:carbohydrate ABC transporter permease [Clostridia bacterium]